MTFRTLIRRSLRFHWRSHLGVVLGVAIGSAALIGALVVGDSVKGSLRERALGRLGNIQFALSSSDRLFRDQLDDGVEVKLGRWGRKAGGHVAAVLQLTAIAANADSSARANDVQLLGVAKDFGFLAGSDQFDRLTTNGLLLNKSLADQLRVKAGDEVLLRIRKPSAMSMESPISPRDNSAVSLRLRVDGILDSSELGDFHLGANQTLPMNAFVARQTLQRAAGVVDQANLLLTEVCLTYELRQIGKPERLIRQLRNRVFDLSTDVIRGSGTNQFWYVDTGNLAPLFNGFLTNVNLLRPSFQLADAQLEFVPTRDQLGFELRSSRVLLDSAIDRAVARPVTIPILRSLDLYSREANSIADSLVLSTLTNWMAAPPVTQPIFTYLATLLRAGTNATPYSMVTATGSPWTPAELKDDEIVVSQWLADDLQLKPGDTISLNYFLPESGARLEEATNTFRVHSIVPLEMPWADRTLMPDFPGIEKAESTSEWDAGFPLTYEIRKKDDDYWKQYRGTPKAFITLAAGQKMWGNRFGNLTAIRFPIPTNEVGSTLALTPALSPEEREKRSPASEQSGTAVSTNGPRTSSDGESSPPLPGGEGRGEGERQTNQPSAINHQLSTSGTPPHVASYKEALEKTILANLRPEELGLRFEPVREQALKAAEESQDFGGLFLGFSFFLIIAALLLMAMLFQFGLEQRAPEIGTLLALGFTPKQVRKLLLREGVALAFVGGVVGAVGGIYFAKAMLRGLTTIWRDAVGATALQFHVTGQTLVIGIFASVVVSTMTIWLALRKFVKRSPRELLVGEIQVEQSEAQSLKPKVMASAAAVLALGLVGWTLAKGDTANAGAFFGAGALVLIAGLSFASAWLVKLGGAPNSNSARSERGLARADLEIGAPFTTLSLAVRGCARRRKRSLATVAMLACGSFLIVSIGVFRLDANRDATKRDSGTGGFALIGETTLPVVQDLNSASGRDFFALNEADLPGVNFVPFRVRAGDEASCLNLNRAQRPRLLGVKPEMLAERFALAKGGGWQALRSSGREEALPEPSQPSTLNHQQNSQRLLTSAATNEIPAIGDANSIQWAMHKKVGDTIDYVDERGQPFKVRIVGAVANSILQGQLIIDEAEFVKRFPGESGYRLFLVDAPSNAVSQVSATLSRAMQDVGLELTPAAVRLNQFNAVQNTYLGTFQVLGGLGLLLGSVGLGIVVLRNVLERRSELAVLLAVGFGRPQVQRLLLVENGALLLVGLAIGVVAAGIAVLPALLSPAAQLPVMSLAITLVAVLANGALWTWAATRYAVRGDLLAALRNE